MSMGKLVTKSRAVVENCIQKEINDKRGLISQVEGQGKADRTQLDLSTK
jgi:hypothetical protein